MNFKNKFFKSANWRVVIPNLKQYTEASEIQLTQLKYLILQRLKNRPQDKRSHIKSQFDRGLRNYRIALQHHANGVPHLDILLVYDKSIKRGLKDFDFLYKHGNITTYRSLNKAIIDYGKKQDKDSLHNFPCTLDPKTQELVQQYTSLIQIQEFKKDPYKHLQSKMRQDPFHFNLQQYCQEHDLYSMISSWSSIKSKLKDSQLAAANLKLKSKPGFKFIDRPHIQSKLSQSELILYDSWSGYQTIVDHLNQICTYGFRRPLKTSNLLITGLPNIGKTALFHNPNHSSQQVCVQDFTAVYQMGMVNWFPKYQSDTYSLILWNEAKLTSYPYDTILKLLEGSYCDLPAKGSSHRKVDNPLIIMTSNMTLDQMITQKFCYNLNFVNLSKSNLSVRVKNVVVPEGYTLFLLQKLITSR